MINRKVQLIRDLDSLKRTIKPVVTSNYKEIFDEINGQIRANWEDDYWKFEISKDNPLTFRDDEIGQGIQFDVFGFFQGSNDRSEIIKQSFTIRVWSLDDRYFDEKYCNNDLQRIIEECKHRRVIMRFRFEKEEGSGFVNHIQIGGYGRSEDEYCSLPEKLDAPKIPFYPMTIFSICELIISSAYPELWGELQQDTEWNKVVCRSQITLLSYLKRLDMCLNCRVQEEKQKYCDHPRSLINKLYQ